jgi:ATP-dependent protease ClpP protease subunit
MTRDGIFTETISFSPDFIAEFVKKIRGFDVPFVDRFMEVHRLQKRELFLPVEIDIDDATPLVEMIRFYNAQDEQAGLAIEDRERIRLFIDCYGGAVTAGVSIVDDVR